MLSISCNRVNLPFVLLVCIFRLFESRCRLLTLDGDILGSAEGNSTFDEKVLADSTKRFHALCDVQVVFIVFKVLSIKFCFHFCYLTKYPGFEHDDH